MMKGNNQTMELVLDVKGLSIWLKRGRTQIHVVRNLDFFVTKGGCTGIIGESGCGKSLSCQAILGLLDNRKWLTEGNVKLCGEDVPIQTDNEMDRFRGKQISLILQNPLAAFDPHMTIGAHFCQGIPVWKRKEKQTRLEEASGQLKKMEIHNPESVLKSYPFQLSGGMLQRILTALAISSHPKLLIADEPTTALDADVQKELMGLLKKIQQEEEIAILLVSHDLDVIAEMADQIVVMYAGEAIEWGPTEAVLSRPVHPYTEGLMKSRPSFSKKRLDPMEGYPPRIEDIPKSGCVFSPRCKFKDSCYVMERTILKEVELGHFSQCCRAEQARHFDQHEEELYGAITYDHPSE